MNAHDVNLNFGALKGVESGEGVTPLPQEIEYFHLEIITKRRRKFIPRTQSSIKYES